MFGPTGNLRELSAVIAATSGDWKCQRCGTNILAGGVRTTCPDCAALVTFLMHGRTMPQPIDGAPSFDTIEGCDRAIRLVYLEIRERHGEKEARRIFKCPEPSDSRKAEIKTEVMLDLVDMKMADSVISDEEIEDEINRTGIDLTELKKKGLSIAEIARQRAEQNKTLPRDEQRGPGGTDVQSLDHYIRYQLRKREKRRNKELLDCVDRMSLHYTIQEIVRGCAEQNKTNLPPELQHGPGDTDPDRLYLYIRRLLKERKTSPPKR
jgi:hypothetical protein